MQGSGFRVQGLSCRPAVVAEALEEVLGGLLLVVVLRRGHVIKAHRLLYHSTLGLRVIEKKRRGHGAQLVLPGDGKQSSCCSTAKGTQGTVSR